VHFTKKEVTSPLFPFFYFKKSPAAAAHFYCAMEPEPVLDVTKMSPLPAAS
jgi:hypothetical protein